MRKIINGKVYNSETAKLIASNCPVLLIAVLLAYTRKRQMNILYWKNQC